MCSYYGQGLEKIILSLWPCFLGKGNKIYLISQQTLHIEVLDECF